MHFAQSMFHVISIHAPREGSDDAAADRPTAVLEISIHAPREGSDRVSFSILTYSRRFLSTLPARGATIQTPIHHADGAISIHAPREGSDGLTDACASRGDSYFYPRSP